MHRKKALMALGAAVVLASTSLALAHPGRTNSPRLPQQPPHGRLPLPRRR